MKIIITGTSSGIGRRAAVRFIEQDHFVYGIDSQDPSIASSNYVHFKVDIRDALNLPEITDADVLINNAGTQNSGADIEINLKGTINVTEKYVASNTGLTSVLFNASASSITGQEFPEYAASKAGVVGYMKNVAVRLAPRGVTVNALSFGGVYTESNDPVISDEESFKKIMAVTPMKKWMSEDEAADWMIFMTLVNRSMSGQNLLIDNGETNLNPTFVWKD